MPQFTREVLPTPKELVTNGKFNIGTYKEPFKIVNPLDVKLNLPKFLKYFRLKEWQAFQLGNENYFMLIVVYNAKLSGLAQFIFYDKKIKTKLLYEKIVPQWSIKTANSLFNTKANYTSKNFIIDIYNDLENGKIEINIDIHSFKKLPNVKGHFIAYQDLSKVEPIVVCLPFDNNRAMYSHKCLMQMDGDLSIGSNSINFAKDSSFAIVDDHKGYYPYIMKYDWATGIGYDSDKKLIGFNLTDNQVKNQNEYNENCLWIDGKLHLLPPVKFSRPNGVNKDWKIKDEQRMIDITFSPIVKNNIEMNLIIMEVHYSGPFGYFNGYIKDSLNKEISINNFFGMGEKKFVRV